MMKAYHMSETLKLGDNLEVDHQQLIRLAQPFIQALERSEDCFYGMVLNGKYLYSVLDKCGLREWANYAKWATEGAFEFIRKTEFPNALSRLKCNYFYDNLEAVKRLFESDWGEEPEEIQNNIHLFEFELDDNATQKYDMSVFDLAYSAMENKQDVQTVFDCARRYFSGEHTEKHVWEILTSKSIKAEKDITKLLR